MVTAKTDRTHTVLYQPEDRELLKGQFCRKCKTPSENLDKMYLEEATFMSLSPLSSGAECERRDVDNCKITKLLCFPCLKIIHPDIYLELLYNNRN